MVAVAGASVAGCSGGGSSTGSVVSPTADATPSGPPLVASEIGDWQKLVGSAFVISAPSGKVSATLASLDQIIDASRPSTLGRHQPFYAVFQMDTQFALAGGQTYQLSHATKGAFDLFLGMPSQIQGKGVISAVLN